MTHRRRLAMPRLLLQLAAAAPLLASAATIDAGVVRAQESGYGQTLGTTNQERNFYDYGPQQNNSSGGGSIFNATNPMDLLNRLKKGGALNDATAPGSAIDAALKDFEAKSGPASVSPGPVLKGP
ncbi:MAG: hypothetical protein VKI83_00525 [Synechococcaceae cyanobacterium]|nr:hypothetical protein [Synechococcaceae cyanobacterium]